MVLKTIWYAVLSRLKPIIIDIGDLIQRVKDGTQNYYLCANGSVFLYDFGDDCVEISARAIEVLKKLNVNNVVIHIIAQPYVFWYMNLGRYLAGVGVHNYQNLNICAVAKYSFLKKEIYPYLEHEIAHAVGLLKYDHSNINDFIQIIKYR